MPGLPLPLLGMLAYGSVALLSLQQSGKNLISGLGENDIRFILLVTTTSMATASAYFLYILSTKFAGTTCSYCLLSALLSFSLFFITLKVWFKQCSSMKNSQSKIYKMMSSILLSPRTLALKRSEMGLVYSWPLLVSWLWL